MFKKIIVYIINLVVGYVISVYLPVSVMVAFNLTKYPGNNPDGLIAVPFGVLAMISFYALFFTILLLDFKKIKTNLFDKASLFLSLFSLALGSMAGMIYNCIV